MGKLAQVQNIRTQGALLSDNEHVKKIMAITLSSHKDLNGRPPKTNKETLTKLVPQPTADKVADDFGKFEYLKAKFVEI